MNRYLHREISKFPKLPPSNTGNAGFMPSTVAALQTAETRPRGYATYSVAVWG